MDCGTPVAGGGIGKNFYEIIRSSREFVEGMGSGRGEQREEGRIGWGRYLLRGKWQLLPPGEFPLVEFPIDLHKSRISVN